MMKMAFAFLAGAALGGLAGYGLGAWTHPYYGYYGFPGYYSPYYAPYYGYPGYWYW
jgi:hypothetical protein